MVKIVKDRVEGTINYDECHHATMLNHGFSISKCGVYILVSCIEYLFARMAGLITTILPKGHRRMLEPYYSLK